MYINNIFLLYERLEMFRKESHGLLCLWGLQFLDLAGFLWDLNSVVVKPKQSMSCMLLTSKFILTSLFSV